MRGQRPTATGKISGQESLRQESRLLALSVSLGKWIYLLIITSPLRQCFPSQGAVRNNLPAPDGKVSTCWSRKMLKIVPKWVSGWARTKKFLRKWRKEEINMCIYFIFFIFKYLNFLYLVLVQPLLMTVSEPLEAFACLLLDFRTISHTQEFWQPLASYLHLYYQILSSVVGRNLWIPEP